MLGHVRMALCTICFRYSYLRLTEISKCFEKYSKTAMFACRLLIIHRKANSFQQYCYLVLLLGKALALAKMWVLNGCLEVKMIFVIDFVKNSTIDRMLNIIVVSIDC